MLIHLLKLGQKRQFNREMSKVLEGTYRKQIE